jgi:hypothetical protein
MWALAARAIHEDGWLGSALGARRQDLTYASHPPTLSVVLGAVTAILGLTATTVRAVAVAASACAVLAMLRLGRACGLDRTERLLAAGAFLSLPMFTTFGSMTDTWTVGLPAGLLLLVAHVEGRRRGRAAWTFVSGVFSWQGLLASGIVAATAWRRDRDPYPLLVTTLTGVLLALYAWWADHWSTLTSNGGSRAGLGLTRMVPFQASYLWELMGPLGLTGLVALLVCAGPARRAGVLCGAAVLAYVMAFPGGAENHAYWAYWAMVPAALGVGLAARRVGARVLAPMVALVAVLNVATETTWERADREASEAMAEAKETGASTEPLYNEPGGPAVVFELQQRP